MIELTRTLRAWGTDEFEPVLKDEITRLDPDLLPLQEGLSRGSYSRAGNLGVMVLGIAEQPGLIRVRIGLLYTGVIAGCNCADDPTPVDELAEYCEVEFEIDRQTAATRVTRVGE